MSKKTPKSTDDQQQILEDELSVIEATFKLLQVGPKWSPERPHVQIIRENGMKGSMKDISESQLLGLLTKRYVFVKFYGSESGPRHTSITLEIVLQKQYPKYQAECRILKAEGLLEGQVKELENIIQTIAKKCSQLKEVSMWEILTAAKEYLQDADSKWVPQDTLLSEYLHNEEKKTN